ncbi:MAG TPA: hypothetical protein VMP11_05635 [Verrucomicrobiae bacterium]|nr:hypothetical protein [Verrucomicrobiae bacterium]
MSSDFRVRGLIVGVCVLSALISFSISATCSADVFSSSVSLSTDPILRPPPSGQPGYEIQTWSEPNETGASHCYLDLTINSNLVLSVYDANIGQIWYVVTNGAMVSSATQSSFPLLEKWGYPGQMQLSPGQDFYLGLCLLENWIDDPPYNEYGWVHLQYTASGLSLLGNEIDDSGAGVIVVPEPSALCLAALAVMVLPLGPRSSRKRQRWQ